ncbi:MAG: hypothetical protein KF871_02210 [Hydrogenophaga sp.]|uniref:hypothetical protein n=1 Tax=Hydrogenophaga sp. TaxID=1904254 RepID=UPI001D456E12|nr:hypothetical protein [Hydrogenophaga sp.]MBX3608684.1 hypothetical protein [Hydrogenophaga sp.]
MFALAPRIPADFGNRHFSEWHLSSEHSLLMQVQRGDLLRAERGTVWIRLNESPTGLALRQGEMCAVPHDGMLCMTGADQPLITVASRVPITSRAQADYGGWRHQPPVPPTYSKSRLPRLLDRWLRRPVRIDSDHTHA